jgi:cytochrome c oxidase subunit 3
MPPEMAPAATHPPVAHQFNDAGQQREAATLGMWVFLATEVLFFGAMFLGYTVYRVSYPEAWMEASKHTLVWIGGINTGVLLISSFIMVLGVHAMERGNRYMAKRCLIFTACLGVVFLCLKAFEYRTEIMEGLLPGAHFHIDGGRPPHEEMFFYLYFVLTGVHALHVLIGVVMLSIFAFRLRSRGESPPNATAVDLLGLYWHFVDIVWVFLFPLIYLVGRSM